jgi:hypothetical protein
VNRAEGDSPGFCHLQNGCDTISSRQNKTYPIELQTFLPYFFGNVLWYSGELVLTSMDSLRAVKVVVDPALRGKGECITHPVVSHPTRNGADNGEYEEFLYSNDSMKNAY